MQENYKQKKIKRVREELAELSEDDRSKMIDFLFKMEEDESDKRRKETEILPLTEFTEEAEKIAKDWGKITGIKTGYSTVDSLTKGFDPGNLIILAGRTSQYKTMLALNMARRIALQDIPVLFVTLENTKAEIAGRLLKMCESREEYDRVAPMLAVQVRDEVDWRSVDPLIENFVEMYTNGVIFIDHLHYFSRDTDRTAEALGVVTKEFKKNAIRHKVPIILISHVRKDLTKKNDLPSIDDIRGSSLPAQDADIVLMVGSGNNNNVIVEIQKNRNKGFDPQNAVTYLKRVPDGIRII